ncbi:MAG: ABC transporter substrate-binding protein [Chloroflexi bacterium]|nr:ABC transporter substrate-binding protein [Chloroflexota bacterium]
MKKGFIWGIATGFTVLSLLLASCAPAAPTPPIAPTTPTAPVTPTAQPAALATPTTPSEPTTPKAETVNVTLKKLDGTVVERTMEKPKYGGMFTTVADSEPGGFDPRRGGPSSSARVATHDNLIGLDWTRGLNGTGEWTGIFSLPSTTFKVGQLAESWEIPDETTIIFHIRKGIRFALNPKSEASRLVNGREVTADDVVYSINYIFAPDTDVPIKSNARTRWLPTEWPVSVKALDKYTVEVKLNPPDKGGKLGATWLAITEWSTTTIAREVVQKYKHQDEWQNNVGTGPYMITDYVPGSSLTHVRNPNYWQKDPFFPENQLPYPDGVKYLFVTDRSTIMAGLRTGKIDATWTKIQMLKDDLNSLRATNPQIKFSRQLYQYPQTLRLVLNNPSLPWSNIKVRQAMYLGIDHEAIARDYYKGDAEILAAPAAPYPEYMAMYTPLEKQPESVRELFGYNPEKAKKLLAEAGYPKGFKIKVDTSTAYDVDLLQAIKFYLEKVGINLEISVKERAVFSSMTAGRTVNEAGFINFTSHLPYEFEWAVSQSNAGWGMGMVNDPHTLEVREFVLKNYTFNETAVWPVLKEFWVYHLQNAWEIYLPSPYWYVVWHPWVKGYNGESSTGYGLYMGQTKYLWLDAALKKSMGF